jgi:hypothetical protein
MLIYPDKKTLDRLQEASEATGRTIDDLATSAVEEAALRWAVENERPLHQQGILT